MMSFNDYYNMFNPAITQKVLDEQYLNNVQPPSITLRRKHLCCENDSWKNANLTFSKKKKYIEGHKNEGCILLCFL